MEFYATWQDYMNNISFLEAKFYKRLGEIGNQNKDSG
jgi:hypothetical protein